MSWDASVCEVLFGWSGAKSAGQLGPVPGEASEPEGYPIAADAGLLDLPLGRSRVHCSGPRADSHLLCLQPQQRKRLTGKKINKQWKPEKTKGSCSWDSTQQAWLMRGREISRRASLGGGDRRQRG